MNEAGPRGPAIADSAVALREILNETHDIISVIGADRSQKWVSRALHRVLGYAEPPSAFPADFVHPEDRARLIATFESLLSSDSLDTTVVYRVRHADGSWRWIEATARNRLDHPAINAVVAISRDITERKLLEQRLQFLATHDPLTGLANRSVLEDHLETELRRGPASGDRTVVFFIDADGFKAVNDTYGHPAGDQVLQVMAERLRRCARPPALVARYGGDEFVVVMSLSARPGTEAAIAARIRATMADPIVLGDLNVMVGVSVGWATQRDSVTDASLLIKAADAASYRAKHAGARRTGRPPGKRLETSD